MADIPALSESTKRKLAVQWDTLRDEQKLTDEDLSGYDRERQRLLGIAAKPPRGVNPLRPKAAANELGLGPSVRLAGGRFRALDGEYWLRWCSGDFRYEVYRDWLASVTQQISAELASIWKVRSDSTDHWYEGVCRPAVEKALAALVKQRIAQAREVELKGPYRATTDEKSSPENARRERGEMAGPDDSTWDGIFAKNPFPKDDPRHGEAVNDLLRVKEQLDLFDSEALDKRPPKEAPVEQHVAYLVDFQVGRFDILACGLSNRVPLTYQGALEHEQDLDKLAKSMLALADSLPFSALPKETTIRELKVQLDCRKKYWTGQVLKQVREAKEARRAQREHHASTSNPTKLKAESAAQPQEISQVPAELKTAANASTSKGAEDQASAETLSPDPDERKAEYDKYKRTCKDAGVEMTERKLAQLANRRWNTRDPIMKWKAGKDRPGDDRLIRRAIQKGPPASQS